MFGWGAWAQMGMHMLGRCLRGVFGAAAIAALVSGCASTAETASGGGALATNTIVAPTNYRQAVPAKLRQMEDASTISAAEITKPHERWMGLINGGTRPVVCVRLVRPNILGTPATYFYMFYFDNGVADGYQQGAISPMHAMMIGCQGEPLTPFTELKRRV
jgi:hypothetical protein